MPQQPTPSPLAMLMPFLLMFFIFYVLVFHPQNKARKAHQQMLKALKKHDEVVTSGGIFGTVMNVKPDTVTLRIDDNVRVEVERSAIARVVKSKPAESESVPMEKKA
jgi:preprotein translocase subunit YajC